MQSVGNIDKYMIAEGYSDKLAEPPTYVLIEENPDALSRPLELHNIFVFVFHHSIQLSARAAPRGRANMLPCGQLKRTTGWARHPNKRIAFQIAGARYGVNMTCPRSNGIEQHSHGISITLALLSVESLSCLCLLFTFLT